MIRQQLARLVSTLADLAATELAIAEMRLAHDRGVQVQAEAFQEARRTLLAHVRACAVCKVRPDQCTDHRELAEILGVSR